jgi:ribose 5-phosphate isomerase B
VAIAANKVPGVYAATCHDPYSAERARKSNNAQIMTLGSQVIGPELAKSLVEVWLNSEFQGGRSQPKVDKIAKIEEKYFCGTDPGRKA